MNDRERGIFKRKESLTRQEQLRKIEEFDRGRKERMKSMREHTPRNIALSKILGANTPEKIEQARRTIREWIEEHPEEDRVRPLCVGSGAHGDLRGSEGEETVGRARRRRRGNLRDLRDLRNGFDGGVGAE